jgi:signal transduction histidine kinase
MEKFVDLFKRLSWSQRFLLASLLILGIGMTGIGWWVGMQIESGVIHQTAANTALYVSSVMEPNVQELANGEPITPQHQLALRKLLQDTSFGQGITSLKAWDRRGRVVYASTQADVGLVFPIDSDLAKALRGWVSSDISTLNKPENVYDPDRGQRRLETYSPVRHTGTNEIIGAVEFYQTAAGLDHDIAAAQQQSWLIVGAATGIMYLLLAGFVRYASDTIRRQQSELGYRVAQLQGLLSQNKQLDERVRRAAQRTTELNERFLRRIGAELHDGPAQDLGLALLRLDHLQPVGELSRPRITGDGPTEPDFQVIQGSLRHALQELRAISAGMGLPELENLPLSETISRAVRAHRRRTGSSVALEMDGLSEYVSVPVKITVYRIIQEALSNAYRHAGGTGQQVRVDYDGKMISVNVSDEGPGFDQTREEGWEEHLGLIGMRERVESLGGVFEIVSGMGRGTRILARLPLEAA